MEINLYPSNEPFHNMSSYQRKIETTQTPN